MTFEATAIPDDLFMFRQETILRWTVLQQTEETSKLCGNVLKLRGVNPINSSNDSVCAPESFYEAKSIQIHNLAEILEFYWKISQWLFGKTFLHYILNYCDTLHVWQLPRWLRSRGRLPDKSVPIKGLADSFPPPTLSSSLQLNDWVFHSKTLYWLIVWETNILKT